jgi:hypothetical protein
MLFYPESTLQLWSSRRFCEVFKKVFFRFPVSRPDDVVFHPDAHLSKHNPSRLRELSVRTPINVEKLRTVQGCIRLEVMANRPNALQSSRRSQCSSASVRTTWLYRSDTIRCLTSIRVSASRHSYRKTAETVRKMCDPVRTMFSIRQDVHTKFNCPDDSLHGPDDQASYMEIACTSSTVRTSAFRVQMLKALLW